MKLSDLQSASLLPSFAKTSANQAICSVMDTFIKQAAVRFGTLPEVFSNESDSAWFGYEELDLMMDLYSYNVGTYALPDDRRRALAMASRLLIPHSDTEEQVQILSNALFTRSDIEFDSLFGTEFHIITGYLELGQEITRGYFNQIVDIYKANTRLNSNFLGLVLAVPYRMNMGVYTLASSHTNYTFTEDLR